MHGNTKLKKRKNLMKYDSFPWPPVVATQAVRGLQEHCIATDVGTLDKLSLYTAFSYVHFYMGV